MPKDAIIIGMPRSGTSMVTSIFAKNGFFLAENESKELRAGDEFNPSGYWEAQDLIDANDEILSRAGYKPDNTWLYEPIKQEMAKKILELSPTAEHRRLVEKYNNYHPWVWKDPRLCYTIGYWWPLLHRENTRIILLKRDSNEIYNSFVRLKWRENNASSKKDVFQRIQDHLESAKIAIEKYNIPVLEVSYSDFGTQAKETSQRVSEFFGISLETDDLGFDTSLNTSNLRGRVMKIADAIADFLPDTLRKFIKKMIPKFLLKIIFPNRY